MADTPARRRPAKPGASTSRPGAKKAAATKPAAKKPVAKKPATKKPGAKKPAQKPGVKKPGAKPGAKRPAKKLSWPKRILLGAFFTVFTVTVLGAVALVIAYNRVQLPEPNAEVETQTTQVFFGDAVHQPDGSVTGTLLGELAEQNRTSVEFSDMPQSMRDSVIAAENRGFWTDPGISISGILRSAKNIAMGEPLQSGSTITQQYIKTLYLTSDQTPSRKAKEILLAVKMGRGGLARKQDVLQGYLNTIWFGRGAYGVQAAAQTYFGVDARDLTLPQSAALAAILNQPAWLDPLADPENIPRFTERYRYVLDGLLLLGEKAAEDPPQPFVGITQAEYDDALANPPEFPTFDQPDLYAGDRGFLLKMVEDELIDNGFYSEDQVQGGGLKIVTTFDQAAQAAAATAVQQQTEAAAASAATPQDAGQLHGALASIEVGTGEVVALYGGPDYIANQQNWALTRRQAGSTFKPYAMLAGLRAGMNL
ncbi:MAG: transglycosylase domain-containing protein, partial [Propionibacteriaceae bacterium]|nr:transglycosylase domain-containing protein [Propionibacteriaceae bacterium]